MTAITVKRNDKLYARAVTRDSVHERASILHCKSSIMINIVGIGVGIVPYAPVSIHASKLTVAAAKLRRRSKAERRNDNTCAPSLFSAVPSGVWVLFSPIQARTAVLRSNDLASTLGSRSLRWGWSCIYHASRIQQWVAVWHLRTRVGCFVENGVIFDDISAGRRRARARLACRG